MCGVAAPADSERPLQAWIRYPYWLGVIAPYLDRPFRLTRSAGSTLALRVLTRSERLIHLWIGRFEPGRRVASRERRPSARRAPYFVSGAGAGAGAGSSLLDDDRRVAAR